jgi:hypothetical protein
MTPDGRFERIESGLIAIVEVQRVHAETLSQLMQTVSRFVDSSALRAQTSDARLKRIEESLEALIRAITAEHSNGKH